MPKSPAELLSEISSSEEVFNKSNKIYSKVLKESGFTDELKYLPNEVQQLEINEVKAGEISIGSTHPSLIKKRKDQCG